MGLLACGVVEGSRVRRRWHPVYDGRGSDRRCCVLARRCRGGERCVYMGLVDIEDASLQGHQPAS